MDKSHLFRIFISPVTALQIDDENAEMKWKGDKAAGLPVGPEPMPPKTNGGLVFPKSKKHGANAGAGMGAPAVPVDPAVAAPAPVAEAPVAAEAPTEAPVVAAASAGSGDCKAVSAAASDEWCMNACNAADPLCPDTMCKCK